MLIDVKLEDGWLEETLEQSSAASELMDIVRNMPTEQIKKMMTFAKGLANE